MTGNPHNLDLLLGSGGSNPGVRPITLDATGEFGGSFTKLTGSVYAIDVHPSGNLLACATRAGTLHLFYANDAADGGKPSPPRRLLQGRAVLSVCFAPDGSLVSADETGQVLHWPRPASQIDHPARWRTNGRTICALSGATGTHVAGLGADGEIVLWADCSGDPADCLGGPPPAQPVALARFAAWLVAGRTLLAYPADGGQLALIQVDPPAVRAIAAYDGPWFAAFQVGERLATIGHDDGLFKLWRWTGEGPVCDGERPASRGVIDAEAVADHESTCVAVFSNGRAAFLAMRPDSLTHVEDVSGDGYRVITAPGERLRRRLQARQAGQRAEELRARIAEIIESRDEVDLTDAFSELERLRFRAAALGLRAQLAWRRGDVLGELETRHRLATLLPRNSPDALLSLQRYATLLQAFGQFELALEVANQVDDIEPGRAAADRPDWLPSAIEALRAQRIVVFAGPEQAARLAEMITAARIVDRPLMGLWELHRSRAILLPDVHVKPARLAEALRATNDGRSVHVAAPSVLWVDVARSESVEVVLLAAKEGACGEALQLLLRTEPTPTGTELTRSILLDPGPDDRNDRDPPSDDQMRRIVDTAQQQAGRAALLAPFNGLIHGTLRRLRSVAVANGLRQAGGAS